MERAIILVDHGSRVPAANRMLEDLAALLSQSTSDRVYAAHMELAEPTLAQAFASAAKDGARRVYVFPYFLSPGRHSTEDIPRLCEQAARATPKLAYHCGEPIGIDAALVTLILDRISRCPDHAYRLSECATFNSSK